MIHCLWLSEYDTVCDGIEKAAAAGKFKSSPQTNLSASKSKGWLVISNR